MEHGDGFSYESNTQEYGPQIHERGKMREVSDAFIVAADELSAAGDFDTAQYLYEKALRLAPNLLLRGHFGYINPDARRKWFQTAFNRMIPSQVNLPSERRPLLEEGKTEG